MPRLAQAEDWRAVRALRLRALADAPDAFEMTLAQAEQWTDEEWRRRVAEGDERPTFVEEDEDRNLVGMAVGLFEPAARVVSSRRYVRRAGEEACRTRARARGGG